MSILAPTVPLNGPIALRALARAFGQFDNFDRFVGGLQAALDSSTTFKHSIIAVNREMAESVGRFPAGALSFPLLGDSGSVGALQTSALEGRRQFAAEDLHLLAGLADFLGAVLTQAQRLQDAGRGRELLRLLLNQAPVGIAAYGADRRPIVANELAVRWLGAVPLPFEEIETGGDSFYLRSEGKLVYGEARRVAEVPGGAWIFVLHDLTPEQGRLMDGMQRELYRARAEKSACSLVLLEVADARHSALRRLPALRATLQPGEIAGPYDAHRVGLIVSASGLALRRRLRNLRPILDDLAGVRLGYSELGRDGRTPEALLHAALQRYGGLPQMLRPALLIHDENPGVAATLAMVLGREFRVVQSGSLERTRDLLDGEPFEGIIAEWEPGIDRAGHESIVRLARGLQPGIRIFYTSVQPAAQVPAEEEAVVIEKPFEVSALVAAVRQALER
ncbi:MAG: hypothetical protein C0518_09070 [Opitutus sp.]|nr:hypothetical protein [Opitutus sp.]